MPPTDPASSFDSVAATLAPAIHETYRRLAREQGWDFRWDVPFEELPVDIQADNLEAAARIPVVLARAGLQLTSKVDAEDRTPAEIGDAIEAQIELLAEAEHDGWMAIKQRAGWTLGPRDDARKVHPCLLPYAQLSEADKRKDRNSVRTYADIVDRAGFRIAASNESVG